MRWARRKKPAKNGFRPRREGQRPSKQHSSSRASIVCHPERSEGSLIVLRALRREPAMLCAAQHDTTTPTTYFLGRAPRVIESAIWEFKNGSTLRTISCAKRDRNLSSCFHPKNSQHRRLTR